MLKNTPTKLLLLKILRITPLVLVGALITGFVAKNGPSAISVLVERSIDRPWTTAFAFMALFLLKSVSFGLPFAVLYIGVGSVYPLGWAVVINIIGIIVNMQIPYFLGRHMGESYVQRLLVKYPALQRFESFSKHSSLLFSFTTKFIGKIPHEITNTLLGALKIPYTSYIFGGVLGLAPTMVATTMVGSNLTKPGSPMFILSLVAIIALGIISFILFRRFEKKYPEKT